MVFQNPGVHVCKSFWGRCAYCGKEMESKKKMLGFSKPKKVGKVPVTSR